MRREQASKNRGSELPTQEPKLRCGHPYVWTPIEPTWLRVMLMMIMTKTMVMMTTTTTMMMTVIVDAAC